MSLTIHRTGASDYGNHVKALVSGAPGSGKTRFSSTFKNPLFASAEGGLMSIADRNIPYVEIKHSADLLNIKNILDQDAADREKQLGFPVDTIVIDTIDEIQRIFIAERLADQRKEALTLPDWGWLSEKMQNVVRGFRNLPLNVVFTCHVKEVNDSESGGVWHKPALQGGIADQIAGYVDLSFLIQTSIVTEIVDNQTTQVEKRILITKPSRAYPFLKDRSGKLSGEIPITFDGDYDRIYDTIFGDLSGLKENAVVEIQTPEPTPVNAAVVTAAPDPVEVAKKKASAVRAKAEAPKEEIATVKPLSKDAANTGAATGLKCEECGGEVESQDQADFSRIRYRAILDKACFDKRSQ